MNVFIWRTRYLNMPFSFTNSTSSIYIPANSVVLLCTVSTLLFVYIAHIFTYFCLKFPCSLFCWCVSSAIFQRLQCCRGCARLVVVSAMTMFCLRCCHVPVGFLKISGYGISLLCLPCRCSRFYSIRFSSRFRPFPLKIFPLVPQKPVRKFCLSKARWRIYLLEIGPKRFRIDSLLLNVCTSRTSH